MRVAAEPNTLDDLAVQSQIVENRRSDLHNDYADGENNM